jgi:dihydroflavonol-4-reductase
MSNMNYDRTVLVTGGSGYIGGWAIVELLRRGFEVRTTLRDPDKASALRQRIDTEVDSNGLRFFSADLAADAGWDEAMKGVRYVLHVASPMTLSGNADLLAPARDGTLRVLQAASRTGVQRVVVTSSLAAATPAVAQPGPADDAVWTDPSQPGLSEYARSKTLAELAAWDYMRKAPGKVELATVLPGLVQGPLLGTAASMSLDLVARMLKGQMPAVPRLGFPIVDVRDLVDLHIRVMTQPAGGGQRWVGSSDFLWMTEIAALLKSCFGERAHKVSTRVAPDFLIKIVALFQKEYRPLLSDLGKRQEFSAEKAEQRLGWRHRTANEAVIATAESLMAKNLV